MNIILDKTGLRYLIEKLWCGNYRRISNLQKQFHTLETVSHFWQQKSSLSQNRLLF